MALDAPRFALVAGEASGDLLAGHLLDALRSRWPRKNASQASNYTDQDAVREETIKARRAFERRGWPTIDVTRRSVEETAAAITNLLSEHRNQKIGTTW